MPLNPAVQAKLDAIRDGSSERCSDCGRPVKTRIDVPDELWDQIIPGNDDETRCFDCLNRRASDAKIEIQWIPTVGEPRK